MASTPRHAVLGNGARKVALPQEAVATDPTPSPADRRLVQFCTAVLGLFGPTSAQRPVLPVFSAELVRALEAGVQGVASDLRRELSACDAAIEHLGPLTHSRYLEYAEGASALLAELEQARARAGQVIEALEAIQETPTPAHGTVPPLPDLVPPPPRPTAPSRSNGHPPVDGKVVRPIEPSLSPPIPRKSEAPPVVDDTVSATSAPSRPTPIPAAAPTTSTRPIEVPSKAPPPTKDAPPRPRTGPATDPRPGRISVTCPCCGEPGTVNWDRLDKILHCGRCTRRFGVKPDGKTVEVVRTADGRWVDRSQQQAASRRARSGRRRVLLLVLCVGLLLAAGFSVWRVTRPAATAAEMELPHELEPRVELFGRAWARGDVPLMRRLTTPTQDRQLYSWYMRHQPSPRTGTTESASPDVKVEVSAVTRKPQLAVMHVRVQGLQAAGGKSSLDLNLLWEVRGDTWYFIPPPK
jgi:hypothetical protein